MGKQKLTSAFIGEMYRLECLVNRDWVPHVAPGPMGAIMYWPSEAALIDEIGEEIVNDGRHRIVKLPVFDEKPAAIAEPPSITQLIERAIKAITVDSPAEDVFAALNMVGAIVQAAAELKQRVYAECRPWFEQHGDIQTPAIRWRLATEKTYECLGKGKVIEALLDATGGDFEKVCDCLSSNPFKEGAIKSALDEAGMADKFNTLFKVGVRRDVKTDKPLKKIVCENMAFVKVPRKK